MCVVSTDLKQLRCPVEGSRSPLLERESQEAQNTLPATSITHRSVSRNNPNLNLRHLASQEPSSTKQGGRRVQADCFSHSEARPDRPTSPDPRCRIEPPEADHGVGCYRHPGSELQQSRARPAKKTSLLVARSY